jgi:ABC-type lipoprotein release transport system permease subunit
MNTTVQTIDRGQIWIPLDRLQKMADAEKQATIVVLSKNANKHQADAPGWKFVSQLELLKDLDTYINQKKLSAMFLYIILIGMALIAVFDTQVLAIFRRRKEMGTLMALGMTRIQVVCLFTIEGTLLGVMALMVGAIYGIPVLTLLMNIGITLPSATQQVGLAIGAKLYPHYALSIYVITAVILFVSVVVVSFLPTRQIMHLRPTEALKGKI